MKHFLGIDIGLKGGISILTEEKKLAIDPMPMPTIPVLVGKRVRQQYDIKEIVKIFKDISTLEIGLAGIERLRPMPMQSSQTSFSIGQGVAIFKSLFAIHKIKYIEIEPMKWQRKIFDELLIEYTGETTKDASKEAAKMLFPDNKFRLPGGHLMQDGLTDSALIGYYIIDRM